MITISRFIKIGSMKRAQLLAASALYYPQTAQAAHPDWLYIKIIAQLARSASILILDPAYLAIPRAKAALVYLPTAQNARPLNSIKLPSCRDHVSLHAGTASSLIPLK